MFRVPKAQKSVHLILIVLIVAMAAGGTVHAGTEPDAAAAMARLENAVEGGIQISVNKATGTASFVRLDLGELREDAPDGASLTDRTLAFLDTYASAFGLVDPASELELMAEWVDNYGLGHVRFRQVYQGIPVFGAEFKTHFDPSGKMIAAVSSTFRIGALEVAPSWEVAEVENIAVADVLAGLMDTAATGEEGTERGAPADDPEVFAANTDLLVFRTGLVQGIGGSNHLAYRVEVLNPNRTIREFVFVGAQSGKVLDRISGIHEALDRKTYEGSFDTVIWEDSEADPYPIPAGWEGGTAQQVTDWQNEIDGARETYNVFASMTAGTYLSYDGVDATMRTINNAPINCPNASWNGVSTNYCSGVTGDDTVAHEWGHAFTEYTAGLIYAWQTGALSESYSDIWGEVVDFQNGRGTDSPGSFRTDGSCSVYGAGPDVDDSYRWLSGEDDPAFGGAIRDLWTPTCYGDPGKVSDTEYVCSTVDGGGVHTNSGVPNHAFALMVDGGTYNGETIAGIGLLKAAHIHWGAQNMLVPTSAFSNHADALQAACTGMIGANLSLISTNVTNPGLSGALISAADCAEVAKAIAAVELRTEPTQCGFETLLDNNPPPICEGNGAVQSISLTDWEAGLGTWTVGTRDIANEPTFDTPDWAVVGDLPDERAGMAAFVANDPDLGDCGDDNESGVLFLQSPVIAIPGGTLVPRVAVNHWVDTEAGWDGGNVKLSINGGAFAIVPTERFEVSPYNSTLFAGGNTNPMAGEDAFTGADGGSVSGSWGGSHINLLGLVAAGDDIQLRFEFGLDGCNGVIGWYVDEVEVYSCSTEELPICGDSILDFGEMCDDGNMVDGDGCSMTCQIEEGWLCEDPIPANPDGDNVVADGSFEGGVPSADWTPTSTFGGLPGFPIYEFVDLAFDGDWLVWIGGIPTGVTSSVEQDITIPAPATDLTVQTLRGLCDDPSDTLHVSLDGNDIGTVVCNGTDGNWVEQTFPVAPYNDGGVHTLFIGGTVGGTNGGHSNIFVDDVFLNDNTPKPPVPSACYVATCGDGVLDDGEQCDDGNVLAGDGCSNACLIEDGFECTAPVSAGVIMDPSFEAGAFGGIWTEFSSTFGTPICDVGSCGTGTGTGPSDGDFWVWFGGISAEEEGSVSQSITIAPIATELTFDLEQILCDSGDDYMEVLIDGNQEFLTDGESGLCSVLGYAGQSIDITAYADGGTHTLEFHSEIFATNGGGSNFFVDLVDIPGSSPSVCVVPEIFADGFESGDTTAWSSAIGLP